MASNRNDSVKKLNEADRPNRSGNTRKADINQRYDARGAAFNSLLRCECGAKYSNLEIDSAISRYKLEDAEKRLYTTPWSTA